MEEEQKDISNNDNNENKYNEITKNLDIIDTMANDVINNSLTNGIFENKKIKQIFTHAIKRPTKNYAAINKQTIVYQLPGVGESKYKNYDKITIDIKKVELAIRKENEIKRKKKLEIQMWEFGNLNNEPLLTSDNYDEEKEEKKYLFHIEEYNILEVIQKFKILPEKRTIEDVYITKNYLFQTKLTKNYINEFNNDKKIIENIITFCGLEFKYKKFEKGEVIFKIGDAADNFYIILLGKVDLLKTLPKIYNLTGCEYFNYIMNLIKVKENYRYKLCIKTNKKIYPINIEDEGLLPYIYLHFVLEDVREGKEINFREILDSINITPKEIGLEESKLDSPNYVNDNYKIIIKKFPNISDEKIRDYKFIYNKFIKKPVKLYDYDKFMTFESLDYFGENSIENNTSRNGTMICSEDTEVIYLNSKLYINNILTKKAIILERKTAFLCKNYLFEKIPQKKFEKKYFSWFILETYHKGDILFKENSKLEYVYFLKEGSVKLLTSKSILEIEIFKNEINKKIKNIQNIFNNNINDSNNDENEVRNYNTIKADAAEISEHINKREKIKLFILKSGEDIGIESYFLGMDNLTTCIVDSITAKIYKIDIKYLTEIFTNEKICFYELIDRVGNKLKLFSDRLYEINNTKLSLADQKINDNQNAICQTIVNNNNNNINITCFSEKNKINFNFNRIKEIVNNNKLTLTLPNLSNRVTNSNIRNSSRNIYDNYLNLSKSNDKSIKNKKVNNVKNSFYNIKQSYNKTNSKLNTNYITKSSISINKKIKNKNLLYSSIQKNLKRKKFEFPYEDEFLNILKNDFHNLAKEKLILTKPSVKYFLNKEASTKSQENIHTKYNSNTNSNTVSNTMTYTQNNNDRLSHTLENNEKYSKSPWKSNNLLMTQIDTFNKNVKSGNKFFYTEDFFKPKNKNTISKKILNNKTYTNVKNKYIDKKFLKNNIFKKELIKQNSLKKIENNMQRINIINNGSNNNNNNASQNFCNWSKTLSNHKNIEHPYIAPLTLIKLKKYKMISEKDHFLEDKKRYEINQKENYKIRGLNSFGYPLFHNKAFIRRSNNNSYKEE